MKTKTIMVGVCLVMPLLVLTQTVSALSCAEPESVAEKFENVNVVFSGKVLSVENSGTLTKTTFEVYDL